LQTEVKGLIERINNKKACFCTLIFSVIDQVQYDDVEGDDDDDDDNADDW